jgi:hypothetical protein
MLKVVSLTHGPQQERLLITLVLKIVNIFALDLVIISEVQGAAATYQIVRTIGN